MQDAPMQEFEGIRPYRDDEVPGVIERLVADPDLNHAMCVFLLPRMASRLPRLSRWLMHHYLRRQRRRFRTVKDFQDFLSGYMARLINETITELSVEGVEHLEVGRSYLFISNHRDIFMGD